MTYWKSLCVQITLLKKFTKKIKLRIVFLFQNLTDKDSTSLFFIFIGKLSCSIDEKTARNTIFEVLTKSKVLNRQFLRTI